MFIAPLFFWFRKYLYTFFQGGVNDVELELPAPNRSEGYAGASSKDAGGFMGVSESPPGRSQNGGGVEEDGQGSKCVLGACLWRQRRQLEQFKGSPEVCNQHFQA